MTSHHFFYPLPNVHPCFIPAFFFPLSHLPSYFISSFLHLIPSFIKLIFCLLFLCLSLFLPLFLPSFLLNIFAKASILLPFCLLFTINLLAFCTSTWNPHDLWLHSGEYKDYRSHPFVFDSWWAWNHIHILPASIFIWCNDSNWLCYFRVQHLPFRERRDSSGDITSEEERKERLLKQKEQDKRTNDSIKHPLLVVLQR